MTLGKLKASLWVKARVRQCDLDGIPVAITRRGDPDAGAILVKIVRPALGCEVFTQFRDLDGGLDWVAAMGEGDFTEAEADAFIGRQIGRDPDLWVVEIEDHQGIFRLDG